MDCSRAHHPGGTLTSARPVSARWPLQCANGCWGQHDASWKGDKKVTFWGVQLGAMLVTPAVWDVRLVSIALAIHHYFSEGHC